MAHRPDQMSDADRQLLADPAAFLQNNIVIVRSPIGAKRNGPQYWKLIPTQTADFVTSTGEVAHRKNCRGRIIPCYNLRQSDEGGIQAIYVHWEENNVVPGVLPSGADDADFFITATMNGWLIV